MDSSLLKTLIHVGLSERQAATYLALLEQGPSIASTIAQSARVNRSVVYEILRELMDRGYVTETATTKVKQFIASDPHVLFQSVRAHFEDFKFLMPLLRSLHDTHETSSCIEIYEGHAAVTRIFQSQDDGPDRCFIASFGKMATLFPEETKRWPRRTKQLKQPVAARHIAVDDEAGRVYAHGLRHIKNQQFRFLPKQGFFHIDLAIIGDRVILSFFSPTICAVVIRSEEVARSAKTLFDLLWKHART